jgi:sporulation-control protein spo0M
MTDDRDPLDRCTRTPGCTHRFSHGGACSTETPLTIGPADLYAYAIRAGVDMLTEIQKRDKP